MCPAVRLSISTAIKAGEVTSARVRENRRRGLVCGLRRSNAPAIVALYKDTLYTYLFVEDYPE